MPRATITKERFINQDVLAQRIHLASEADRIAREEEQGQKVRGYSDKQTELFRRINKVSEEDSVAMRRELEVKEHLEEENERLKAQLKEDEEYGESLREELGAYL